MVTRWVFPLRIAVKNPWITWLCLLRLTFEHFLPEILAAFIFTRQPDAALKVHRFRKKIDRGEHQHCRRRGPRNGMLLTWRWRRRWRIEGEIFLRSGPSNVAVDQAISLPTLAPSLQTCFFEYIVIIIKKIRE